MRFPIVLSLLLVAALAGCADKDEEIERLNLIGSLVADASTAEGASAGQSLTRDGSGSGDADQPVWKIVPTPGDFPKSCETEVKCCKPIGNEGQLDCTGMCGPGSAYKAHTCTDCGGGVEYCSPGCDGCPSYPSPRPGA